MLVNVLNEIGTLENEEINGVVSFFKMCETRFKNPWNG